MHLMYLIIAFSIVQPLPPPESPPDPPPLIVLNIDRDNIVIDSTCRVVLPARPFPDTDGNGVIHITGDNITVDLSGSHLQGNGDFRTPNAFDGIGIRITGRGVTLRGARVSGYRIGILATGTDDLVIESSDLSGNYRQRLASVPTRARPADMLSPLHNHDNEWQDLHGAGLWIMDCREITVRRVLVHNTQNGIVLARVTGATLVENDCAFLSGWGIALWDSTGCDIHRNTCRFCVRGYEHAIYAEEYGAAGILVSGESSRNRITANTTTCCGDGILVTRGCRENLFLSNLLADSTTHGIDLEGTMASRLVANRFRDNAASGIRVRDTTGTTIAGNTFHAPRGDTAGTLPAAIEVEGGDDIRIDSNHFNAASGRVLLSAGSGEVLVTRNTFLDDGTAIDHAAFSGTLLHAINVFAHPGAAFSGDDPPGRRVRVAPDALPAAPPLVPAPVAKGPPGEEGEQPGRDAILMTEWGPLPPGSPGIRLLRRSFAWHQYQACNVDPLPTADDIHLRGNVRLHVAGDRLTVSIDAHDLADRYILTAYEIVIPHPDGAITARDTIARMRWDGQCFPWTIDPREDIEAWRREPYARGVMLHTNHMLLDCAAGSPRDLMLNPTIRESRLPDDRFGIIAESTIVIPRGGWRVRTVSDEGIRLLMNGQLLIEDWAGHANRAHERDITLDAAMETDFLLEYYEVEGEAILSLDFIRLDDPAGEP